MSLLCGILEAHCEKSGHGREAEGARLPRMTGCRMVCARPPAVDWSPWRNGTARCGRRRAPDLHRLGQHRHQRPWPAQRLGHQRTFGSPSGRLPQHPFPGLQGPRAGAPCDRRGVQPAWRRVHARPRRQPVLLPRRGLLRGRHPSRPGCRLTPTGTGGRHGRVYQRCLCCHEAELRGAEAMRRTARSRLDLRAFLPQPLRSAGAYRRPPVGQAQVTRAGEHGMRRNAPGPGRNTFGADVLRRRGAGGAGARPAQSVSRRLTASPGPLPFDTTPRRQGASACG